ncbi:hypothetical protein HYALB_00011369 [Hymenoscyphus albidus]|uniref:Cytochrome P450 n=1 Tax=Hymenoscyphus albidus TaxID=595503 RepID=A0A9N9Q6W2_9HELO|nr:hypothetical protein HYALB_00011369 [Hymenoscyphus albidus]
MQYSALLAWTLLLLFLTRKLFNYFLDTKQWHQFGAISPIPSAKIYTPRDSMSTWLFSPLLYPIFRALPFNLGQWFRYVVRDNSWKWKEEAWPKEMLGDVWWAVGPGGGQLWISDAGVNVQVVTRRNDFVKKVADYAALNIYGLNVVSSEGIIWQRHRKITGPPFNEKNSSLVFEQTLRQSKGMLASFTQDADGKKSKPGQEPVVEDLVRWTMIATLNVISGSALNIKALWPTHSVADISAQEEVEYSRETKSESHGLPFQRSFDSVMNNVRTLVVFPPIILRNSPLKLMRSMQQASEDFKTYMHELIHEHKSKLESGFDSNVSGTGDLLGSIVRGSTGSKGETLSEEEMIGNIFVFVLAGHETSGTTLQSAIILLACFPEVQRMVQEEIDGIWREKKECEELVYGDYGKMRVIMAVMLETLRLYPPVVMLPKFTVEHTTLTYNDITIEIPADSRVSLDIVSTQRNPKYWNPNPHQFTPSRWLMPPSYVALPEANNESPAHANLLCPPKGAFIAFASGFRGCLGRKFAQVEFCTLIAVLLKECTVELVQEGGEKWEEAKKKTMKMMDNRTTALAMRLNCKIKVRFVKRGSESFPK